VNPGSCRDRVHRDRWQRPCETQAVNPTVFSALVLVAVVAGCSYWVLQDARARTERRRPVVAAFFGFTIEDPQTWAVLCLFVSVLFVPMYFVARRADD